MKYLIFFLVMFLPYSARAVTVGGISVSSKYSQPLILEIELFNLYDVDYKGISVRTVPRSEHGIKGTTEELLRNVSYGIYTSNGIGWISITSPDIIYGGPVDFVIEVKWPGGRTFRHYKVDLIGKSGEKPAEESVCPSNGVWIKCIDGGKSK